MRYCAVIALLLTGSGSAPAVEINGRSIDKEHFYVYLFIGHSNMSGRYLQEADFEIDDSRICKMYKGREWSGAKEPYARGNNWGGPCNFFLEKMIEFYPAAEYPGLHFGILNNGYSSMKALDYCGEQGDEIIAWADSIKDQVTIGGVFVLLGYMDRRTKTFSEDAAGVVEKFRSELDMPGLPVIWGDLESSGGDGYVYDAIGALPGKFHNLVRNTVRGPCGSEGTGGLPKEDNHAVKNACNKGDHHFNWYGYKRWGHACARLLRENGWAPYQEMRTVALEPVYSRSFTPDCVPGLCSRQVIIDLAGRRCSRFGIRNRKSLFFKLPAECHAQWGVRLAPTQRKK
jgi:hypothetical protein